MSEKEKKINKNERIAFYNELGQKLKEKDYLKLLQLMGEAC